MSAAPFDELESTSSQSPEATIDCLISHLTDTKQFDQLFDALCLKAKHSLNLPIVQPTSFNDVPEEFDERFKTEYVSAARHVGNLLLENQQIPEAWIYFRTIGEHEPVRAALEQFEGKSEFDETTEQMIQVALYEGAHPVKGLELLLKSHGTCNTITAMDQSLPQMNEADRQKAAEILVQRIYSELQPTLQNEVQQRMTMVKPNSTIRELIAGRDWLFENGNYHIDVSHLNSVVRFARSLPADSPALPLALELTEYGAQLTDQFQYPGEPPFDDFYPAHRNYFRVVLDEQRDSGFQYFQDKLKAADEDSKKMIAYVMVDLLIRIGQHVEAADLASEYLSDLEDPSGFSFASLCSKAGKLERLVEIARERKDPVAFVAALLSPKR